MNKRKQNWPEKEATAAVLLKSQEVFLESYRQSQKVSALIAMAGFNQLVQNGLPISEAHRILNSDKEIRKFLDIADTKFLKTEQGRLNKIENNTDPNKNLFIAVAVSSFFFVASCFAAPFVTAWLQPTADELLKPRGKAPETAVSASPQQQCSVTNNTTNESYYIFEKGSLPTEEPIKSQRKPPIQSRRATP